MRLAIGEPENGSSKTYNIVGLSANIITDLEKIQLEDGILIKTK